MSKEKWTYFACRVLLIAVGIGICAMFLLCTGCATRVDRQVLEYQRQIDRLEEELRDRDRTIADVTEQVRTIAERSSGIPASIDDIIRELDEYQRAVQQVLRTIDKSAD